MRYRYSSSTIDDSQLRTWLRQAKSGNRTAFDRIMESYQSAVYNHCYTILRDVGDAEDATQETFLRAYLKLDTFDESRKFSTWLFAIAYHYCLDQLKKHRFSIHSIDEIAVAWQLSGPAVGQPEQALLQQETPQEVRRLMGKLSADYRKPLVLKYWYDMSCSDIAQATNTTVSATKSRLFRARKRLVQAAQQPTTMNETALSGLKQSGKIGSEVYPSAKFVVKCTNQIA